MGPDGASLSCPGSSAVADSEKKEEKLGSPYIALKAAQGPSFG